ncbi:hypothetical protein [Streptomyces sp. NPDC051994]|uniref:hypothetical protein n=1 Tax=unclassified Streptomyces TaxID=2593676 RepID=UPI003415A9BF
MSKSDKECAQAAVAAALVSQGSPQLTQQLMESKLTTDEMQRAQAYLQSGQKLTGR